MRFSAPAASARRAAASAAGPPRRRLHVKKGLDEGKLNLEEVQAALDRGLRLHLIGQMFESQVVAIVKGERVKRSPNRGEVLHRLRQVKEWDRGGISRAGEQLGVRGKRDIGSSD